MWKLNERTSEKVERQRLISTYTNSIFYKKCQRQYFQRDYKDIPTNTSSGQTIKNATPERAHLQECNEENKGQSPTTQALKLGTLHPTYSLYLYNKEDPLIIHMRIFCFFFN